MTGAEPVLRLEGVEASYRSFRALFGIDLEVDPGSATALVGANGAGKSTVARVASGLVPPTAGRVLVEGRDLTGRPAHEFTRAGIAHAPEGRAVFSTLTVADNLRLAFRNTPEVADPDAALEEAFELFPRLAERRDQLAGTLSGGEQRMLTLARVLVIRPRLLIADELSLGLAPLVTGEVYQTLAQVKQAGCALLIVEQHLDHALDLADSVVVIRKGEVAFRGTPSEAAELTHSVLLPSGNPASTAASAESRGAG